MWVWFVLGGLVVLAVVALALWSRRADRIEDETRYATEGGAGAPYGSLFLSILRGRRR